MVDPLHGLIHKLMYEPDDPGEIHTCPICSGILFVRFETYPSSDMFKLGVNAFCEQCKINLFIEYKLIEDLPYWEKAKKA